MLMLPLDVGNYRIGSNISMDVFWYIIYLTSASLIFIVLPFALFYYETDEEKVFKWRLWTAVKYELFVLVITLLILLCSWAGLRYADLPVTANTCSYFN